MSLEQAQEELQNALVTTFLANLAFLSEYDNELYHRVDELSHMIENGIYKEKYALEFIQEDGDFDIYDMVNDKYLYEKKPKKINNKLINEIQLDTKNAIFALENIYYKDKNVQKVPDEIRYDLTDLNHAYWLTKYDVSEFTTYLDSTLIQKKRKFKYIDKFIFFGSLLGRHIPRIAEKVDAESYLVCERNLEIFRLSLFTVDYTVLAQKGVLFSIMDEQDEENSKLGYFIHQNYLKNFMFKFSSTSINVKEYIETFLQYLVAYQPTTYDYNRYLYTFIKRTSERINENYKMLLSNKTKELFTFFKDKRVLFVAAGPSVDENIKWIKKNQNKFFIVAVGRIYEKLLDLDIKVDMITTLDEQYYAVGTEHFRKEAVNKIKDSIILASAITHKKVLDKFDKKKLFLFESFVPFFKDNTVIQGFSIGETTMGLLLCMNVKELYIVGLDLSVNQNTGDSHSNTNSGTSKYNLEHEKSLSFEESKKSFGARSGFVEVKGNKKDKVFTQGIFSSSILCINNHVINFKSIDTNIYNLSSHGAFFENTIPQNLEDINIEEFEDCIYSKKNLIDSLTSCSTSKISEKSKKIFIEEIKKFNEYLEKDCKDNKSIKDFKEFYLEVLNIYDSLLEITGKNSGIFSNFLQRYFQIIINYLSFYFNDVKIKNEKEKILEVRKILLNQLNRFIKDYVAFLSKM